MKKRQKRLLSILLTCVMMSVPSASAFAETDYEASMPISEQMLFPGDSLVNLTGSVFLDGTEVVLEEAGIWRNREEDKVYEANTAEDGSMQLTQAGYVLTVVDGISALADTQAEEKANNHYEFLDWELPQEGEQVKDIAAYESGVTVKLTANAPKEGQTFAGWTTDTEGVVIADPSSLETTIVMPEKKAVVMANYAAVQQETTPETTVETSLETSAEQMVDITVDVPADPATETQLYSEETVVDIPATYQLTVTNGEGSGSYGAGDWITISAYDRSAEGYGFSGWYVDSMNAALEDASSEITGFTMPSENVTITANYTEIVQAPTTFDLVVNYGTGGGTYQEGAWIVVTANDRSAEGLAFAGWTVDTANAALEDAYAASTGFAMPAGGVTLTATYTEIQPQEAAVTVNNGTGSGIYEPGSVVTVTAEDRSATGEEFTGWFVESMNVELDNASAQTANFTMTDTDVVLTATYAAAETELPSIETESQPDPDPADETTVTEFETEVQAESIGTESETAAQTEPAGTESEPAAPETEITVTVPETQVQTDAAAEVETNMAAEEDPYAGDTDVQMYEVVVENGSGDGLYEAGAAVTIEADEQSGLVFKNWVSDNTNVVFANGEYGMTTFVMPAENVKVTAEFGQQEYTVSLVNAEFADDAQAVSKTYAKGENVTLKAKDRSGEGLKFKEWQAVNAADKTQSAEITFTYDETTGAYSFTMPEQNIAVEAVYEAVPNSYKVTVSNGLINGAYTELMAEENTVITVKANPAQTGQAFAQWNINDGTFDMGEATFSEEIKITVTQDLNILAVYEGIEYAVSVTDGYSDYDYAPSGTVITLVADEAPEGMEFDYWYVDSQNVALTDATQSTTTFTMPEGEVSVSAHYRQVAFIVTVENGGCDQEYYYAGDTVTVTSNYPANGRVFGEWKSLSGNVTFTDASRWQTTFTMPSSDVNVKATYTDGPSTDDNLVLDIVAGGEYLTGSTIKFTASGAGMANTNPNPGDYRYRPSGYQIGNVTGTWQTSPYSTSMSIKAAGEYTLKVIFNKDIYDGSKWVSEGTSDAKSVTFRVVTEAAGVDTGDETPLAILIAVAGVSCVLFIILLIVFLRRRRNR